MATLRQKQLAKAIVENAASDTKRTAKDLLISAGYDVVTADASSTRTIEQKGVQEELIAMGFTEDNAKKVVTEIMLNQEAEPNARLKAADMTFKVYGSYAPDKSINLNVNADISPQNEKAKAIAERFEAELLNTIAGETQ